MPFVPFAPLFEHRPCRIAVAYDGCLTCPQDTNLSADVASLRDCKCGHMAIMRGSVLRCCNPESYLPRPRAIACYIPSVDDRFAIKDKRSSSPVIELIPTDLSDNRPSSCSRFSSSCSFRSAAPPPPMLHGWIQGSFGNISRRGKFVLRPPAVNLSDDRLPN